MCASCMHAYTSCMYNYLPPQHTYIYPHASTHTPTHPHTHSRTDMPMYTHARQKLRHRAVEAKSPSHGTWPPDISRHKYYQLSRASIKGVDKQVGSRIAPNSSSFRPSDFKANIDLRLVNHYCHHRVASAGLFRRLFIWYCCSFHTHPFTCGIRIF